MRSPHTRQSFLVSRLAVLLAAFATACLGLISPAAPAQAAVLTGGASLSHPFSNPIWWPLHTETVMDCYHLNPGCKIHPDWLMDVVSTDRSTRRAHEPVYAMGAGIAHWGVHADVHCGPGIPHSRGNWLWIDHGNGVISWYGHLAWPFTVPDGAFVTPATKIGLIGNSGYSNCRQHPTLHYIDIAIKHGGHDGENSGNYVHFRHLTACAEGQRRTYPQDFSHGRYSDFNRVPAYTRTRVVIPGSDGSCTPPVPRTPDRAAGAHLARSGKLRLTATWTRPTTGRPARSTLVLIQEYHPSIHRWLDLRTHQLSPTATRTTFTNLHRKHRFRAHVMYLNGSGVSAPTPWASAIAT